MHPLDAFLHLLPPAVITAHLLLAPYTKVEESFSLQATHDILHYGIPTRNITVYLTKHYDHLTFPGAVPRSFVGPLLLSQASTPMIWGLGRLMNEQTIVRLTLGLATATVLNYLIARVRWCYGKTTARWFAVLQCAQFHLMFYASRTLPNTFALIPSLMATGLLLPIPGKQRETINSRKLGIILLTASAIIFRAELALWLGLLALQLLITRQLNLRRIITSGIAGAVVGLAATLTVDSYFWLSETPGAHFTTPVLTEKTGLIWPELSTFLFNFMEGKASDWGVMPWHYYFSNSLPKLLLNPITVITLPLGIQQQSHLIFPALGFVGVYSILGHKEWRFIIYILPTLTLLSALGASWLWNRRAKNVLYRLLALGILASIPVSAVMAGGMTFISSLNYPGGQAVERLNEVVGQGERVWLDTETCMTGASRFLQKPGVVWDKNEEEVKPDGFWEGMDWAVTADPNALERQGGWESYDMIWGYGGMRFGKMSILGREVPVPRIRMSDRLWILKKQKREDKDAVKQDV